MKELDQSKLPQKDNVENIREFPKQIKYLGSKRAIPGLILWELDLKARTLNPAEIEKSIKMDGTKHSKITVRDNCLYEQALNKSVAIKKFGKKYKHPLVWAILEEITIKNQIKL